MYPLLANSGTTAAFIELSVLIVYVSYFFFLVILFLVLSEANPANHPQRY